MSITFNVNLDAQKSLGSAILENVDSFTAIKNRAGENIEAASAVYPFMSYHPSIDIDREELFNSMDEKFKNKFKVQFVEERRKRIIAGFSHPMIEAIHTAYDKHYPLLISPDMVWLCIAQGFANHMSLNAEALRFKFVSHSEKELIIIRRDDFQKGSPNNNWQDCFKQFSDNISLFIGDKRDLLVSNFSTTGPIEKVASEVILMDSMKAYFKYAVKTMCGIPKITLTGTPKDWENIFSRVESLSEFDLEWWTKSLLTVISKLIETAKGNPDIEFWDHIYKKQGGSGGPFASGWINTLFPYVQKYDRTLHKNKYAEKYEIARMISGPSPNEFPNGFSKVPFKWQYYNTVYDMEFLGGMFGFTQDKNTLTIIPNISWAIKDTGISSWIN